MLFVKSNFIPGPSSHLSYLINQSDDRSNGVNNHHTYFFSPPTDDHYGNSDLLMFETNHTMFFSSPLDYPLSNSSHSSSSPMFISIFLGIILFTITIWTILGNILVILAFIIDKQIRQGGMSNYLIINLAISDLLLGVAVLPFSASYSTFGIWYFGKFLCEIWLAIDVLCSTASIWGLLMIAFDRYIATNYPIRYCHHRHSIRLALSYICVAWFVSIAICLLPTLFFEKKNSIYSAIENRTIYVLPTKYTSSNRQCELYKDLNFVVTSSLLSFYIPLIIMIFLYAKVLYAIRQQSIKMKKKTLPPPPPPTAKAATIVLINKNNRTTTTSDRVTKAKHSSTCFHETSKNVSSIPFYLDSTKKTHKATLDHNRSCLNGSYSKLFLQPNQSENSHQSSLTNDDASHCDQHQLGRREITAEARVTRSLAVVIGCFICCWLPFFTLYIIRAVCLCLSFNAIEFFVWLGYSNSSINPVLYAILNKNFRLAFKNIFLSVKKILFV
ncbi:unnamed protein product [Rotaria magnacalcarata]|uniref:G-protein coupled receptors family 1 profile domain-containing protein n=1 Tax=Rotaria magnacalcarata TaxID=392030 RepID=A0A816EG66_9BILA|nr:unnamed protein product [Rotaria magnacalcarata]CAF1652318.1 unnamed protein product [Rotaria magnacalcarata]CAF2096218.1 unnamed protein product [Rotaria magnacalcarata]CAF2119491.1 unnamed protein product [Rotaria magnacalcarata]CAF2260901.1 unnamed protein product [Rotaria magnacalcarata]